MKSTLNVGVVVADDIEFEPFINLNTVPKQIRNFNKRPGYVLLYENGGKTIKLWVIYSGVGKVNSAAAAQFLIDNGADILLNYGLSGGLKDTAKGADMVGTSFVEHDFDLTCLGYDKGQKPGQSYVFYSDERLVNIFEKACQPIKRGNVASGDTFVSNDELKNELIRLYNVDCCDMESAAIASVADNFGIPFATLRRISDDAGDSATETYSTVNTTVHAPLVEKVLNVVPLIFCEESFWE